MSDPATPLPAPHLSPKEQFLAREEDANKWRQNAHAGFIHTVFTFALAEWAITSNPNSEQVKAVRDFIDTTLNLGEQRKGERPPFPDKRLIPLADKTVEEKKK